MRSLQNWDSLWQNDGLASDPKVSFVGIQVRICPFPLFKALLKFRIQSGMYRSTKCQ
eukprot:COSAG06_NODE_23795_length_681_cov_1.080756_1_plen_56_part_10